MAYGQKNYNELQGINGKYTIRQIGCFLTAFCNLLERYGRGISPLELNAIFRDRGIYLDLGDGRHSLAYNSITRYDPNVVCTGTHSGSKVPHNDCIVKFRYTSGNGQFNTHFALVADASKGIILDSYDGVLKHWNVYGGPIAYYAYRDSKPKPQPVQPPVAGYDGDTITILPGWGLSHAAKEAGYSDWREESRWVAIAAANGSNNWRAFNSSLKVGQRIRVGKAIPVVAAPAPVPVPAPAPQPDIVNVTVKPGWGITHVLKAAGYAKENYENVAEWDRVANLNGSATHLRLTAGQVVKVYRQPLALQQPVVVPAPAPVSAPAPVPAEVPAMPVPGAVEPAVVEPVIEDWKKTEVNIGTYQADETIQVQDLETGKVAAQPLKQGQNVTVAQTFTKDGVTYLRTQKSVDNGHWFGIPLNKVTAISKVVTDDEDDDAVFAELKMELDELHAKNSFRQKVINVIVKLQAVFVKVLKRNKK